MSTLSDEQQRTLLGQAREGVAAALEQLLDDFRGPALAAIHKTLRACAIDGAVHADEALQQASFELDRAARSATDRGHRLPL